MVARIEWFSLILADLISLAIVASEHSIPNRELGGNQHSLVGFFSGFK